MAEEQLNLETPDKITFDDIIFRGRNKDYGAYVLRKVFPRNTGVAFLSTALLIVLLIVGPMIADLFEPSEEVVEDVMVDDEMEMLDLEEITEEEEEPEEELPPPPPPPKRSQVKFVPPEVVEAEEADPETEIIDVDTVKADLGLEDIEGDDDAAPEILDLDEIGDGDEPVELKVKKNNDPDPNEFVFLEKQPKAVNMDQLKKKIEYPQMARDAGISGRVVFRVLIDENGRYKRHKLMRSPHKWLTASCVKHINKLRFTPGIQAGKPIPVWVTVPFDFKIE